MVDWILLGLFVAVFLIGYLLGHHESEYPKTKGVLVGDYIYYLVGKDHWKYSINDDVFVHISGLPK